MQLRRMSVISAVLLSGCVSSSKYQMKEREAADLQQQTSQLQQQNKDLQQRLDSLSAEKMTLGENLKSAQQQKEATQAELDKVKGTYDQLVSNLKDEISKGEIQVSQLRGRLTVNLVEKILFGSGSAQIKEQGKDVLNRIGEVLKNIQDKDIRIEGHTDNVGISRKLRSKYPTNWELSAARAVNMVRYLQEKAGVDPQRLIACGYSQYHPVASNDTEDGRSQNRRIEIVLVAPEAATPANPAAATSNRESPPTDKESTSTPDQAPTTDQAPAPNSASPADQTPPSSNEQPASPPSTQP